MALSPRRTVFAVVIFSAMPLLVACPKKDPPPVDAAPPPPPEPEASVLVIAPLEDDAGADADADADAKKATGPGVSTNVARLRQCCGQLRTQAKAMGASPEAGMLLGAAAQCDVLANQAGASGTAPELSAFKALLAGRNVPPVCASF